MNYDIFREELATKYSTYGHALWEPSPGGRYTSVEIGDVGFIRQGYFHRLFNILLPEDHPSHQDGVPQHHEPLVLRMTSPTNTGTLWPNDLRSNGVLDRTEERRRGATEPDEATQVSFSCSRRRGAILSLPMPAQRKDTTALRAFAKCIIKHIDEWFAFARECDLGISREDIILVTGCHLTRTWATMAFREEGEQVSFGVQVSGVSDAMWRFTREGAQGVAYNLGPSGQNLPENQCIFIRGFRATRFSKIIPRLRGAAGPAQFPDDDDPNPDTQLNSTPDETRYQDPLRTVLEYIAAAAPDCDMALVHDDDLQYVDIASLESLRPDTMMSYLWRSAPKIWQLSCDISPTSHGDKSKSKSEAPSRTTVAALSKFDMAYELEPVIAPPHPGRRISFDYSEGVPSPVPVLDDTASSTSASARSDTEIEGPPDYDNCSIAQPTPPSPLAVKDTFPQPSPNLVPAVLQPSASQQPVHRPPRTQTPQPSVSRSRANSNTTERPIKSALNDPDHIRTSSATDPLPSVPGPRTRRHSSGAENRPRMGSIMRSNSELDSSSRTAVEDSDHVFLSINPPNGLELSNLAHKDTVEELREQIFPMWPTGVIYQERCGYAWLIRFAGSPWDSKGQESIIAQRMICRIFWVLTAQGYVYLTSINTGRAFKTPRLVFIRASTDARAHFFAMSLNSAGNCITFVDPPVTVSNSLGLSLRTAFPRRILNEHLSEDGILTITLKSGINGMGLEKDIFLAHILKYINNLAFKLDASVPLRRRGLFGVNSHKEIWVFKGSESWWPSHK